MSELKDFEVFKPVELSDYVRKLSSSDLPVYLDKLTVKSGTLPDPYNVSGSCWEDNVKLWPDLTYPDIYNYFVENTSYYTKSDMKCFKSKDGYQYFVCGHVQQSLFHGPKMDNMVYLKANVLPSQRQGSKKDMYTTYLVVNGNGEQEGLIHTAHCTCMAGVGKACSHAAAVAYKVEAPIRLGLKDTACTSSLCAWKELSRKMVTPARLADIDFKRPKYGEDIRPDNVPEMTNVHSSGANQLDISTLKNVQPSAVFFSCMYIKNKTCSTSNTI